MLRRAVDNTIAASLREKHFICQDSHVQEMNSPLLCHHCIQFQQDNGWYFEECKRLTERGVYWFLFLQEYLSPVVSTLYCFPKISYSSPVLEKEKCPSLVFLNWMTQFTFDIYLSQIVRKCAHIPKILKHFSLPFLFFIYIYIYSIYTIFCC